MCLEGVLRGCAFPRGVEESVLHGLRREENAIGVFWDHGVPQQAVSFVTVEVNGGGGVASFPPVAYLCIDVLPILKSAIRDPAERPVAWDFRAGSRFLCPRVCRFVFGRRDGRDLAPTVGHTLHSLSFVLIFLSRFAFRPVLLYLCTGKGSTRVFPFFISPAHHCPQNPEMAYLPG